MISISYISNVFMVTTIFMIILTSVSTANKLYQMVLPDEDYGTYMSRKLESWEEKMSIDDFYYTIHNMDTIHIPEPSEPYDYNNYSATLRRYCSIAYNTVDVYKRRYETKQFALAVVNLKSCYKKLFELNNKENGDLLNDWESNILSAEYPDTLITSVTKMKSCFSDAIENDPYSSYNECFDYSYTDDHISQKYADKIMNSIKENFSLEQYDKFVSCTNEFKLKRKNIFSHNTKDNIAKPVVVISKNSIPLSSVLSVLAKITGSIWGFGRPISNTKEDTRSFLAYETIVKNVENGFTLKELLLARSLIENVEQNPEKILHRILFLAYTQTNVINTTEFDIEICRTKLSEMDQVSYTSTKMFYKMFPSKPKNESDEEFEKFKQRRNFMLKILKSIDHQNNSVYDKLLMLNDNISKKKFTKMLRRRAIGDPNYFTYAMRIIYMSDYLPLPKHLWNIEKNNANIKNIASFIEEEFQADLQNNHTK